LPALQRRVKEARRAGIPVIYVCDAHAPDDPEFSLMGWPPHAVKETEGAQVVAELAPQKEEKVIGKTSYSGFFGTELDDTLKHLGVKELVLTGCVTNICILYTAADAVMRGYRVYVPVDTVANLDDKEGAFALDQMEKVLGVVVER
jgi:nicotinamidase-related amidase